MKNLLGMGREYGWLIVFPLVLLALLFIVVLNTWVIMLGFSFINSGWAAVPALSFKASFGVFLLLAAFKSVAHNN